MVGIPFVILGYIIIIILIYYYSLGYNCSVLRLLGLLIFHSELQFSGPLEAAAFAGHLLAEELQANVTT